MTKACFWLKKISLSLKNEAHTYRLILGNDTC